MEGNNEISTDTNFLLFSTIRV